MATIDSSRTQFSPIRNTAQKTSETTGDPANVTSKRIAATPQNQIHLKTVDQSSPYSLKNVIVPTVSDGYMPPAQPIMSPPPNPEEFFNRVSAMSANISTAMLAMLPIIQAQAKIIVDMGKFQQLLLHALNTSGVEMMQVARAHVQYLRKEHTKIQGEINAAEEHEGILGCIFGGLEMIVGIAICVASDGAASIIGGVMIADGLSKTIAGSVAIADPELVEKDSALSGMLSNGMFAVFGSGAGMASEVFSIASMVLCSANSILAAAENMSKTLLTSTFIAANFVTTCYGMIAGLAQSGNHSKEQIDQSASMGLIGLTIHEVLYNIKSNGTSLHDLMVSHLGSSWDLGIEMALSLVGSMATTGYAMKSLPNFKAPEALANSKFAKLFEANFKHVMLAGATSQIYNSSLQALNAASEEPIKVDQAIMTEQQTYEQLLKKIMAFQQQSTETLVGEVGQDISSIAKAAKAFVSGLDKVVQGDMQMAAGYGQLA